MSCLSARQNHRRSALLVSITRVVASFLGAGLFNFIWLAAFITFAGKPPGGAVSWLLWCLAPPITSVGFSYGIILFDYWFSKRRTPLFSVLPLILAGCVVGAVVIIPIGQMFIGFGMFVFGGLGVLLREVRLSRQNSGGA